MKVNKLNRIKKSLTELKNVFKSLDESSDSLNIKEKIDNALETINSELKNISNEET